jgi:hypothetical protein
VRLKSNMPGEKRKEDTLCRQKKTRPSSEVMSKRWAARETWIWRTRSLIDTSAINPRRSYVRARSRGRQAAHRRVLRGLPRPSFHHRRSGSRRGQGSNPLDDAWHPPGRVSGHHPTGKRITITGIGVFRFSESKVIERWDNFDQLGMMQQLEVIPKQESS